MADVRSFKFVYGDSKTIQYNKNNTVESLLKEFLKQTNSKDTLDPAKIYFMYNCYIINEQKKLSKKISEVFKGAAMEFKISVTDTEGVIGGKNSKLFVWKTDEFTFSYLYNNIILNFILSIINI